MYTKYWIIQINAYQLFLQSKEFLVTQEKLIYSLILANFTYLVLDILTPLLSWYNYLLEQQQDLLWIPNKNHRDDYRLGWPTRNSIQSQELYMPLLHFPMILMEHKYRISQIINKKTCLYTHIYVYIYIHT